MGHNSYHKKEYRKKQSAIMKENWRKGVFDFIYRRDKRVCAREGCGKKFEVIHSDPKIYCSQSCSASRARCGLAIDKDL